MPFILDITDDEPFEIRLLENELEIIATVPFGHDGDADVRYSVHVALIRLEPFEGDCKTELMFSIVSATPERTDYIDSGLATKAFLSGRGREVALDVLCQVIGNVVTRRQPDAIVMTTCEANLPSKALVKYMHVAEAVRSSGYAGGKGDTFEGQHIWMFVKRDNVS